MEGDHVSWLYPARSDAPQGRWQLSEATPRMRLRSPAADAQLGHQADRYLTNAAMFT